MKVRSLCIAVSSSTFALSQLIGHLSIPSRTRTSPVLLAVTKFGSTATQWLMHYPVANALF
jgi:hypothetical protein